MRKTEHTSLWLESLGPFFVGCRKFMWPAEAPKMVAPASKGKGKGKGK